MPLAPLVSGHRHQLDEVTSEERLRSQYRVPLHVTVVFKDDDLTGPDTSREQRVTFAAHGGVAVERQHGLEVVARRTTYGIVKVRHVRSLLQKSFEVGRGTTNFVGRLPTCSCGPPDASLVRMIEPRSWGSR
jgi:hypothetical protein